MFNKGTGKDSEKMKILRLIPLTLLVMLSSCNLEPAYSVYSNVLIPVDERIVPATGIVNQPVNIYASAFTENACWSNIRFVLAKKDHLEYDVVALADFESYGTCPDMIVNGDTTLSITPDRTGDLVITFWMTQLYYETDTVVVGGAPGKK